MLPNFIFIGPDKSGSTWIYEALKAHPEVFVPTAKDLYFFDKNFDKGVGWYEGFFEGAEGRKAVGELSHDYLFSKDACRRIKEVIPDVKLITCLRDPAERAFSHYLFCIRQGLTNSDFLTASEKEYPVILEHSYYYEPLKRYIETFGRKNVLVLRFEEIKSDPVSFISRIYAFIGVDPGFRPVEVLNRKVLPAGRPRVRLLAYLAKQAAYLLRYAGMPGLLGAIKRSELIQKALYVPYASGERPEPNEREKAFLKECYLADIMALERLLGEDFSNWREGA